MDRNPVYDWFRRQGLRYFLGTTLAKSDEREIFFNVQRTVRQGHVQQAEIELFGRFLPHLRHAIRVGGLLGTLEGPWRLTQWLLDRLPSAAFLLDAAGNVVMANRGAEEIAASNDALTVVAERLPYISYHTGEGGIRYVRAGPPGGKQLCFRDRVRRAQYDRQQQVEGLRRKMHFDSVAQEYPSTAIECERAEREAHNIPCGELISSSAAPRSSP